MKTLSRSSLILLLCLVCLSAQAQIITTIAGNDGSALGDGGLATNAGINGPYDVALDGKGNFYITDGYNARIRKVDTAGIITTIAGNGMEGFNGDNIPATAAMLYRPSGLVIDHHGNIYFSDALNNRVRKIDTVGIITTVAGNGNTVYNGDNIPADSAVIWDPHFLALDNSGNLYITEYGGHRIRKVNAVGIITTIAGTGIAGYTGDDSLAIGARINAPYGILLDSGNIFFSDALEDVVRKIDTTGIITTIAGRHDATAIGDGGPADSAMLHGPAGLTASLTGDLYITEIGYRIRKVNKHNNIITTIAGNGTLGFSGDGGLAANAQVSQPTGVTIDASGNIYIADFGNNRIRFIANPSLAISVAITTANYLSVYPNPNNGEFACIVNSKENLPFQYIFTDVTGRIISKANGYTNKPVQFNMNVPSGIYYLQCTTALSSTNSKIIINR